MDDMLTSLMMDSPCRLDNLLAKKEFFARARFGLWNAWREPGAGGSPIHFREDAGLCESLEVCTAKPLEIFHKRSPIRV